MKWSAAASPRGALVSSSPGRTEKLPAPPGLARLLRGKSESGSGSRSRGRGSTSRSSPMFLSKSRSVGPPTTSAADGEPSSPKVTCIGQVRIRGKSKSKGKGKGKGKGGNPTLASGSKKSNPADKPAATRCHCIERALLCKIFSRNPATNARPHRRPLWRRWALGSIRSSSYQQRKAFEKEEADPTYPSAVAARGSVSDLEDGDVEEEETRVFMSSAATPPPKNALLLMRCRSAPHNRSSALATARFAVSPPPLVVSPETPVGAEPASNAADGCAVSGGVPEEGPVVLMRSKSEPARTAAAKLVVPEAAAFWKSSSRGRRLALVEEEEWGPPPPARIHTS